VCATQCNSEVGPGNVGANAPGRILAREGVTRLASMMTSRIPGIDDDRHTLLSWPEHEPLVALVSGRPHPRWARRSIIARPTVTYRFDGRSSLHGDVPVRFNETRFTNDPLHDLDLVLDASASWSDTPARSGWVGVLSYELGRLIEPAVRASPSRNAVTWPVIECFWCPAPRDPFAHAPSPSTQPLPLDVSVGDLAPTRTREAYLDDVRHVIEAIERGDIFQANLTQRWSATFRGAGRSFAMRALEIAQPWYGAIVETGVGRTVISLSPELFLDFDPTTRCAVTRPIKGTQAGHADPDRLAASVKDAAELHMITDLMRNDLGRVCELGSIRVDLERGIEAHPTVQHGVSEVSGRVREGLTRGELLRATFPAGSITGAPKIRAMQIIETLEPDARGPYCGAIGWFGDDGSMTLNVAIRTITIDGAPIVDAAGRASAHRIAGTLHYGAGGGIVADSTPEREYEEHLEKMAVLEQAICSFTPAARVNGAMLSSHGVRRR